LAQDLFADGWNLIDRTTGEKVLRTADDIRVRHCRKFRHVYKAQQPPGPPDNKNIVVNMSKVPFEEATCLALIKGRTFAVAPASVSVNDILCGVEKAIGVLPEETAEKIRQETVRILKGSFKPKDKLTGAERRALRAFKANEVLTVLPADKGNAAVEMGTSGYNQKIATLLEDKAYKNLKKDPTEFVEHNTLLLLRKSPIA
jgi:hypothetical protein